MHKSPTYVQVSLSELETVFGLAVTTTSDAAVAKTLLGDGEVDSSFPVIMLYDHGSPSRYQGRTEGEDAAFEARDLG